MIKAVLGHAVAVVPPTDFYRSFQDSLISRKNKNFSIEASGPSSVTMLSFPPMSRFPKHTPALPTFGVTYHQCPASQNTPPHSQLLE